MNLVTWSTSGGMKTRPKSMNATSAKTAPTAAPRPRPRRSKISTAGLRATARNGRDGDERQTRPGQEDEPQRYREREQHAKPATSVRIRNSTMRSGMASRPAGASTDRRNITVTEG